ncbi:MAG: non-canonical purine NTP pyrophosphatase [Candidatus Marsarchaeota archaeon]|nr:non-canonical purine NTP pyrophosphatase [Candidatus Marsarchaeota archaeon]MCL5106291.1 non-canonical purine NTP pyrophosphatase [Candidatus Marsarchaeota archaeon]
MTEYSSNLKQIYVVTSNKGKLKELTALLGIRLTVADIDLPEIQSLSVKEVAIDKAMRAYAKIGKPVLVEDTGLYIDSFNGFPGALIKWVYNAVGNDGICGMMKNAKTRRAYAETCICMYDGLKLKVFISRLSGIVAEFPRGNKDFGWGPIFQPNGHKETFGEMDRKIKNSISMRAKALMKLKKYIG